MLERLEFDPRGQILALSKVSGTSELKSWVDPLPVTTHCSMGPTGSGDGGQGWGQGPVSYSPGAAEGNAGPELPCPMQV